MKKIEIHLVDVIFNYEYQEDFDEDDASKSAEILLKNHLDKLKGISYEIDCTYFCNE